VDEVQDIGRGRQSLDCLPLDDRHLVDLAAGQLGEDFIAICSGETASSLSLGVMISLTLV